jgi:hypothetical protein
MNKRLTEQIVHHVLANLGVLPADFVNPEITKAINDKQFLLPEKVSFESEDGTTLRKNIYGCQVNIADTKEFKMMLVDCTEEKDLPEFCLLVQLKDAPLFGMYLIFSGQSSDPVDSEALIAVSTDKQHWMPCSTYLEATFLAGMEQIRDLGFGWTKISNYSDMHKNALSFIKFHHGFYGELDEGKEN